MHRQMTCASHLCIHSPNQRQPIICHYQQSVRPPFRSRSQSRSACILKQIISKQRTGRGNLIVTAAIFGVGAPEAVLVGVVALVVFGPKGLAQAVKSLGATLKTFAPSIRELASVTNDLSSTLQEQIGLDDIRNEFRNPPPTYRTPTSADASAASTSSSTGQDKDLNVEKVDDKDLQAKIEESKRMAWGGSQPESPGDAVKSESPKIEQKADTKIEQKADPKPQKTPRASEFSIEELEAELKRRKEAAKQ